jgi:hypothetical protein
VAATASTAAADGSGRHHPTSSKWWVPGSVTMGDGQGCLEEILIALRPWNHAGGNGTAGAGECGVCGGEFFPTLTGGPFAREERVTGGPTTCGA